MDTSVDINSKISKMIVKQRGSVRTLYFVRDDGRQAIESQMDMEAPHKLRLRYTRSMFASYLFVPEPKRVLIVGLGAGSMVHFLQRYEPRLYVEAVDIDPVILEMAAAHFDTHGSEYVTLIAADGLQYIRDAEALYDVIYIDAFLKPSVSTDVTGIPLELKTAAFYEEMQRKLAPGGAAVFNLHLDRGLEQELAPIQEAFASTHVFEVPSSKNYVVVATQAATTADAATLERAAEIAAPRFRGEFSVADFVPDLM
jgi:spermidine synthase